MIDESLIFEVILVSLNISICINTDTIHININIFQLGFWLICQVDVLENDAFVNTDKLVLDKRCILRIQNKDDLCFARIIVTAKAKKDHHEQRNSAHLGKPLQEEMERHLHQQDMPPRQRRHTENKKVSMRVTWLTTSRHIKGSFQWDHLQRHGSGE